MIVYALSPRAAVIEAATQANVTIVPVGRAEVLRDLPYTDQRVAVEDPLEPLQVARALVTAGVEPGDPACVCIGLGDDSSQSAALVNASMHLAGGRHGSFAALERMRNKYRLRQCLGSTSPLNGRYWLIDDPSAIPMILEESPKGIVVKPVDGSGSRSVTRVSSPDDALAVVPGITLLAEEYFSGPEYSVEMISWRGTHHPLVITKKQIGGKSGLVEVEQRQPAYLTGEMTARLFNAAAYVLTTVKYDYGLSHIEFILEHDEPRLVEAHGRVGGDRISDLMHWSIGISGFEMLFRAYRDDRVPPSHPTGLEAAIEFVDLRNWQGSDQEWLDIMNGINGVVEACILRPHNERFDILSSSDRHAHVVAAGYSVDKIMSKVKNFRSI